MKQYELKSGAIVWFCGVGEPKKAQVVNVSKTEYYSVTLRLANGRLECSPPSIVPLDCWNGNFFKQFEWLIIESKPDDCLFRFDDVFRAIAACNGISGPFTVTHTSAGVVAAFDRASIRIDQTNMIIRSIHVYMRDM